MVKFKLLILLFFILALLVPTVVVAEAHKDFSQADYVRALRGERNLAAAKLDCACFKGMDLSGVDFSGAELDEVNFENANLAGANFTNADLEGASLRGANLKDTIFSGAELEFATWTNGRICGEGSIGGCW